MMDGINVIGYISGNLGLGVVARSLIALMLESGLPVAAFDLDPGLGRKGHDAAFETLSVARLEDLPFSTNLIVLSPDATSALLRDNASHFRRDDRFNCAMCFWELPVLPRRWLPLFNALDVIVAASDYMRHTFSAVLSGPLTIAGRVPLQVPGGIRRDRRRFLLPEEGVLFFTSFEPHSDVARKNPFAVITAFKAAAARVDVPVGLVVKINNQRTPNGDHPIAIRLADACRDDPRIRVISDTLEYVDLLALCESCDVYVSLHRAEGLGLGMMEAMALGKPVIATAWSGNTSFMDHSNACLVSYTLVPIVANTAAYSRASLGLEAKWAEPDVDEASRWMARLSTDPRLREEIGARARLRARQLQAEAQQGLFLREIGAILAMKPHPSESNAASRQQRFDAFLRTAGAADESSSFAHRIAQRSLQVAIRAMRRLRRAP